MMKITDKIFLGLILCLTVFGTVAKGQQKGEFKILGGEFILNGKPIKIHSGEMHYPRIPKAYWKHRLQMVKAMGMNTVSTYVFWNYHETSPGVWDFKSESRNLREFVELAAAEGLMVILRPGPFVCAEWEFGGYPWWLQLDQTLVLRTHNKAYLTACRTYIEKLMGQVRDLQIDQGGPIILMQTENEFGSYVYQRKDIPSAQHDSYNTAIKNMLIAAGATVPLFTSDGTVFFKGGSVKGILPTANGEENITELKKVVNQFNGGQGPYMIGEFYPGWLTHWSEPMARVGTESVREMTKKYLDSGISFNYYVVHGGTNFGFTSGANFNPQHPIQPDITSYDYDAPISEGGRATAKYLAIRALMQSRTDTPLPPIPTPIPTIAIPDIRLTKANVFSSLKTNVVNNERPLTFEDLGQGHGYVLYSRKFETRIVGTLQVKGLRDYATVYVEDKRVDILNRMNGEFAMPVHIPAGARLTLPRQSCLQSMWPP